MDADHPRSGVLIASRSTWTASPSPSAAGYEWEWVKIQIGPSPTRPAWNAGGTLDVTAADDDGVFSASIPWVEVGAEYQIRVRTTGLYGASDWAVSDLIVARGPYETLATPTAPLATAVSASRINITATQVSDYRVRKLWIYANSIDSPLTASLLDDRSAGASVTVTTAETGLAADTTRYYFTRASDQWGNLSDFSASASATTTS
ncbi:hypothetical protein [Paracoccus aminovorans]|uniref:hypothetical protein n=1 Tax=Paracoccus aminovorans TaxID=34004 RepID=UPI001113F266|nr:hypothetical protein [Paracoccus aminovorans]